MGLAQNRRASLREDISPCLTCICPSAEHKHLPAHPLCTGSCREESETFWRASVRYFLLQLRSVGCVAGRRGRARHLFSAKQSQSLQVTLSSCHQQHTCKTHSAARIIKPTHLTGVWGGCFQCDLWPSQHSVRATREWDRSKRSSAEISTSGPHPS